MNVPALRFKDDDGHDFSGWEQKLFGDIFTFFQTNSFSRALLNYDSGIVKNIHYGDIHTKYKSNFKIRYENVPFINSDVDITNISSDCYCKEGDLVIADASEDYADIGKTIEIINTDNQKLLAGLHTYIARDLTNKMSLGFSGYLMQTESVRLQIKTLATGISVLGISKGNFGKVQLNIPSLQEQTKIANFLTAVDEKITLLTKKAELLSQYKKGVMQQIFSQELRFKDDDGQEFPEWEEKTLGEICSIVTGKLDANAMVENGEYRFYTCAKQYYQIDNYSFDTDALLISGNGANVGYIHHYKGKFNAYQRTYVLDGFQQNILFMKYFLDIYLYARIFTEKKEGNTPYIVMATLTEMQVYLPALKEQTKIANFLTAIDEKITNNQTQLDAVKHYKQGLLQQMFV
jgi:type I restriction enzyme S subunit